MSEATRVVVVTGLSGAGKSTATNALEDLGYYCVDNLPAPVVGETLDACEAGGSERIALGIDVRMRNFLDSAGEVLDAIAAAGDRDLQIVFLDASDEALLRRFSSTRRPHPLSRAPGREVVAKALLDGIRMERERLASLRARASLVLDTTALSVHDLRRRIVHAFGPGVGATPRMRTRMLSFGFKYGPPVDADLVLDVRFLRNPYFVDELRDLPGTEPAVRDYVLSDGDTARFIEHAKSLLEFCLPRFEREGKAYLTVAIGCTGGRHRSVALTERMAALLAESSGLDIDVMHRDVERAHPEGRKTDPDLLGGGPRGGAGTL